MPIFVRLITHYLQLTIMKFLTLALLLFASIVLTAQVNYTGHYKFVGENATLALLLTQNNKTVNGQLSSTTGSVFTIEGELEGESALGICANEDGGYYFEAFLSGNELTFGLISPDANNIPDYSTAQYIVFTKTDNISEPIIGNNSVSSGTSTQSYDNNSSFSSENEVVSDPMYGYSFSVPQTWKYVKNGDNIILGHDVIAGIILIYTHASQTESEMAKEMALGIQEDANYLNIINNTTPQKKQSFYTAEYKGMMDGGEVKATGYGILSPYGGGLYILAIASTEVFSNDLKNAAENLVLSAKFSKPQISEVMRIMSGNWTTITKNTTTKICFCLNGSYTEYYESAYSGSGWGTANSDNKQGRWTIQGNRESGRIDIEMNSGKQVYYDYSIYNQNGGEYLFNNTLYYRDN